MKRVLVIGCGGSGKSTLARHLGSLLDISVIHLDSLYWRPGWVETPREEWRALVQDLVRRDCWIMDGNYSNTLDIRLPAADTVVFLDFPRLLCLWRVVKRRWQYAGRSRPDMAPGCPERLSWQFIRWIWSYPGRRPAILRMVQEYAQGSRVFRLRSPAEVKRFLEGLERGGGSPVPGRG